MLKRTFTVILLILVHMPQIVRATSYDLTALSLEELMDIEVFTVARWERRLFESAAAVDVERTRHSFKAALELGLRRRFHGDPQHLQFKVVSAPIPGENNARRQFLVLFDRVPGGTGYLKDLREPKRFKSLLKLARDAMRACDCRATAAGDGCYRCVYAYQDQYALKHTSKQAGLRQVQAILDSWGELSTAHTLGDVPLDAAVESELEQRFLDVLGGHVEQERELGWEKTAHGGKECFRIRLPGRSWLVIPQVHLGPAQGVSLHCRPDFLIRPDGYDDSAIPVAVFCDGLAYHVQPDKSTARLADDIRKREALIESGRYRVWSVTWKDVGRFAGETGAGAPTLFAGQATTRSASDAFRKVFGESPPLNRSTVEAGSMFLLWHYLEDPTESTWQGLARAVVLTSVLLKKWPIETALDAVRSSLREGSGKLDLAQVTRATKPLPPVLGWLKGSASASEGTLVALLSELPLSAFKAKRFEHAEFNLRLYDGQDERKGPDFEASWRSFLQAWNLLQFLDMQHVTSSQRLMEDGVAVEPVVQLLAADSAVELSGGYQGAEEVQPDPFVGLDPDFLPEPETLDVLRSCWSELPGMPEFLLPVPRSGGREGSDVIELGWPEQKVLVADREILEPSDLAEAIQLGWTVLWLPLNREALLGAFSR